MRRACATEVSATNVAGHGNAWKLVDLLHLFYWHGAGPPRTLGSFALERVLDGVAQQCVPAGFPGDQTNGRQDSRELHGILGRVPHHDHLLGTRLVASLHFGQQRVARWPNAPKVKLTILAVFNANHSQNHEYTSFGQ